MSLRFVSRFVLPAAALFAIACSPALADELTFTLTGVGNSNTISFTLPSGPTPAAVIPSDFFVLADVAVDVNGTPAEDYVDFYTGTGGLGIANASDFLVLSSTGPQLFSNSLSAPMLSAGGPYTLTDDTGDALDGVYNLEIVDDTVSVTPEPSSFVLLGTGLLGVAGVLRRGLA